MIIQYVVLGYADLVTDILGIIELMTINVPIAVSNLLFIVLERGTRKYNVFVLSIALGILGASVNFIVKLEIVC